VLTSFAISPVLQPLDGGKTTTATRTTLEQVIGCFVHAQDAFPFCPEPGVRTIALVLLHVCVLMTPAVRAQSLAAFTHACNVAINHLSSTKASLTSLSGSCTWRVSARMAATWAHTV